MDSRYREEESLLSLDIVEQTQGNRDIKLYRITDFGKEIVQTFKK
jgi:predicted transcriptional regulator with HTH domain